VEGIALASLHAWRAPRIRGTDLVVVKIDPHVSQDSGRELSEANCLEELLEMMHGSRDSPRRQRMTRLAG
jgi:hypothetical protein